MAAPTETTMGCIILFFVSIFVGLGLWKLVDLVMMAWHFSHK